MPSAAEQLPRLLEREPQVRPADLAQSPASRRRCSPRRGSSRVTSTTSSRDGSRARNCSSQPSASAECELVQVINDQDHRCRQRIEVGQQPVDRDLAAKAGRRNSGLAPCSTARASASINESQNRWASRSTRSTVSHARRSRNPAALNPRAHKRRLSAACGRAHEHDFCPVRCGEAIEQLSARHQPPAAPADVSRLAGATPRIPRSKPTWSPVDVEGTHRTVSQPPGSSRQARTRRRA